MRSLPPLSICRRQTQTPPKPDAQGCLTEAELAEIERLARENPSETYRGPLLALVGEVRRLREVALGREVTSGR